MPPATERNGGIVLILPIDEMTDAALYGEGDD